MLSVPVPCDESKPIASLRKADCTSPNWPPHRTAAGSPLVTVSSSRLNSPSYAPSYGSSADIPSPGKRVENSPLISQPSSSSRQQRRSLELPASPLPHSPPQAPALFPYQHPHHNQRRQHVLPIPVNVPHSRDNPGPSNQYGFTRSLLGSSTLSSFASPRDVPINSPSPRPRTSYPVFNTTSALAAHHGIPQNLPPVPRTTRFQPAPVNSPSDPVPSSSSSTDDFSILCSNYLTMLSQKPEETGTSAADAAVSAQNASGDDAAVQALMEVIQASPEFHMANDFSEYLTSPMDDSPWDDFLTTPAIGSADMASDLLTSPAIVDTDDFNSFGGVPLFADRISLHGAAVDTLKAAGVAPSAQGIQGPPFNFDDMYRMPSPSTPALDPASLGPSPRLHSVAPPNSASGRRKKEPTGTRKNVTPETLVPYDAPIQTRKYVTPSATSRKEVPAVFAKKRSRSQAFGDEEDQLLDRDSLAPSDVDAIEAKRRQNTLAARRSRKRKLEYQRELEQGLEQEKEEKEMWKSKAVTYAALLRSHGIEVPGL